MTTYKIKIKLSDDSIKEDVLKDIHKYQDYLTYQYGKRISSESWQLEVKA